MTNREKFILLAENDVKALRIMSDERFVEWMTHGGFHWGAIFQYFALTNGYEGFVRIDEKKQLVGWLNEEAKFSACEALDLAKQVHEFYIDGGMQ